eukprot:scaffold246_cov242-Pinguiococcus_pyrenoidosus.AAC.18
MVRPAFVTVVDSTPITSLICTLGKAGAKMARKTPPTGAQSMSMVKKTAIVVQFFAIARGKNESSRSVGVGLTLAKFCGGLSS